MDAVGASYWPLILTSAGVGAIVSAGVTFIGQVLERGARRRELLLSKAIELAQRDNDRATHLWEKTGVPAKIQDDIVSAETYFKWLDHLWKHGSLPDDPAIERLRPK